MPTYNYQCEICGPIEIFHSIMDDAKTICPYCNSKITKLISSGGAVIIKGREANQFADIQMAKYWRDKNGVRHPVTSADGTSKSSTVSKQIVSEEVAKQRTKADRKMYKKQRSKDSYNKFVQNVNRQKHP